MKYLSMCTSVMALIILSSISLHGQAGNLDISFGKNGIVKTSFNTTSQAICRNIITLPSKKILATGTVYFGSTTDFTLVRYFEDGMVDSSFGENGFVHTPILGAPTSISYCSTIQPDGKIILGGDYFNGSGYAFAVVRYTEDGRLDSTFNQVGMSTYIAKGNQESYDNVGNAVALQSNGKIVLAGTASNGFNSDFAVIRFNSNGTIDSTFGEKGAVITPIGIGNDNCYSMTVQADDKIILGGDIQVEDAYQFTIARYMPDGAMDTTFAHTGIVVQTVSFGTDDDYGYSVVIQKDGKILLGGTAKNSLDNYDYAMLRFNQNGSLDEDFGIDGIVLADVGVNSSDYGRSLAIQQDGKIILAGRNFVEGSQFGVMRFTPEGKIDSTFGGTGRANISMGNAQHYLYAAAIDSDGRILIGGQANLAYPDSFIVIRYLSGQDVGFDNKPNESLANSFKIFPNPGDQFVFISNLKAVSKGKLEFIDVAGRVVSSQEIASSTNYLEVDTSHLSEGIYFVRRVVRDKSEVERLIIGH